MENKITHRFPYIYYYLTYCAMNGIDTQNLKSVIVKY